MLFISSGQHRFPSNREPYLCGVVTGEERLILHWKFRGKFLFAELPNVWLNSSQHLLLPDYVISLKIFYIFSVNAVKKVSLIAFPFCRYCENKITFGRTSFTTWNKTACLARPFRFIAKIIQSMWIVSQQLRTLQMFQKVWMLCTFIRFYKSVFWWNRVALCSRWLWATVWIQAALWSRLRPSLPPWW